MGLVVKDDGWRVPDWLWAQIEPLLPERPSHPLGCHNPRVPDRDALNAILFVHRTRLLACRASDCSRKSVSPFQGSA
jgi:putative transposase